MFSRLIGRMNECINVPHARTDVSLTHIFYRVRGRQYQRRRVAPIINPLEGREGEKGQSWAWRKNEVRVPVRGMEEKREGGREGGRGCMSDVHERNVYEFDMKMVRGNL